MHIRHLPYKVLAAFLAVTGAAVGASPVQLIYSFAGDEDGEYADTDLAMDAAGNLYGTTVQGGEFASGTVWQLTPNAGAWTHTVLYSFTDTSDGGEPYKGVTLDAQGNLYGTAGVGGLFVGPCVDTGCGVVYKLSRSGSAWVLTVIHSFTGGTDGYGPGSRVTLDTQGNVYGMTPTGGAYGLGVVFKLIPDGTGNYTEQVIHTFTGGADGAGGSAGRLVVDATGNVFGLCTTGGAHGAGTVFELSPTASGRYKETTVYAFAGEPQSGFPYGALVSDRQGNLYGTTYYAGAHDLGSIYRLSLTGGVWTQTWLYSFRGGLDGDGPISTLAADAAGNLYGTTSDGGSPKCGCGTIFKVVPSSAPQYSVIYRFPGAPGPGFAYNGLIADPAGAVLYGATVHGGTENEGAIYQLNP